MTSVWNGGRAYGLEVPVNDVHAMHVPQAFGDHYELSSGSFRRLTERRGIEYVPVPACTRWVHSSGTA